MPPRNAETRRFRDWKRYFDDAFDAMINGKLAAVKQTSENIAVAASQIADAAMKEVDARRPKMRDVAAEPTGYVEPVGIGGMEIDDDD